MNQNTFFDLPAARLKGARLLLALNKSLARQHCLDGLERWWREEMALLKVVERLEREHPEMVATLREDGTDIGTGTR